MGGKVVDLSISGVALPETLLLDTSVAVPALLPMLRQTGPPERATQASGRPVLPPSNPSSFEQGGKMNSIGSGD